MQLAQHPSDMTLVTLADTKREPLPAPSRRHPPDIGVAGGSALPRPLSGGTSRRSQASGDPITLCAVPARERMMMELLMATKKDVENAWNRAATIRGKAPDVWRRDELRNPIRRGSYGTQGEFGWEVDHRKPKAKEGTDHGRNLRALHWKANRTKSDDYP